MKDDNRQVDCFLVCYGKGFEDSRVRGFKRCLTIDIISDLKSFSTYQMFYDVLIVICFTGTLDPLIP